MPSYEFLVSDQKERKLWPSFPLTDLKSLKQQADKNKEVSLDRWNKVFEVYDLPSELNFDGRSLIFFERETILERLRNAPSEFLKVKLADLDQKIDEARWGSYLESEAHSLDVDLEKTASALEEKIGGLKTLLEEYLANQNGEER